MNDNTTHETQERWRFFRLCETHLAHAREKHPDFVRQVMWGDLKPEGGN